MSPRIPPKPPVEGVSANTTQTQDHSTGFWPEIRLRLEAEWREGNETLILSPKQSRKLALALVGIKKFSSLIEDMEQGSLYYPVSKNLFEKNLHDFYQWGLLETSSLEEKYKKSLQPEWMPPRLTAAERIKTLKEMVHREELSSQFASL